jgi:ribonucleoside-diphosphate reductase alpha chain
MTNVFRSSFSENIFNHKYKHEGAETWEELADTLVEDVCRDFISKEEKEELKIIIANMEFIPGGRYLYYAGRPNKFFNNCYLFKSEEDSREDWANTAWKHEMALMTGGGCGNDYSIYRPKGSLIKKTGGFASGSVSKMKIINEIGREVMQGGSRRSALYASLNWRHGDIEEFLHAKDWYDMKIGNTSIGELKEQDFNFPAPLDMTNISLNYDNEFLEDLFGGEAEYIYKTKAKDVEIKGDLPQTYLENCKQALKSGEPGFSFNFYDKEKETLRNACTEVTSEDDSDVCNLGSINMSRIDTIERFKRVVELSEKFLLCGTLVADLPFEKIAKTREKNRRLGLGLMGVHEWLLKRNYKYEVTPELHDWLSVYKTSSKESADSLADELGVSRPVAYRAIAPTGTIGILAGTTTGIEPIFAVAYKRRYLKGDKDWHYEYVVDSTAKIVAEQAGVDPNTIESAIQLANDFERRIKFQADIQDYVDMSISSTINLPAWGSELNNEDTVEKFAKTLAKYAHRLRGITVYPDGSRGGQPLTPVPYDTANKLKGQVYKEETHDICDITGSGTCGI